MNYHDTIQYLYNLTKHGIKLGLENIRRLSEILGSPHQAFRSIHIAGTNGKGSTAFIIASILNSLGYNVGLFTSPHLVRFTERIRVNNKEISESRVIELTELIKNAISLQKDLYPTFFEFITAMALLYFKEENVDYAVVETGMGGRFDATNIIEPEIAVITPIDLDHMEFLGKTISKIAYEKAGIIKDFTPLIISSQHEDALKVLLDVARQRNAETFLSGRDFNYRIREITFEGTVFDYLSNGIEINGLKMPLIGVHQAENASVAIKAVDSLLDGIADKIDSIRYALEKIRWHGRFEMKYFNGIPFILDGAHNPKAMKELIHTIGHLKERGNFPFKKLTTIIGVMSDKDIQNILEPVINISDRIIATSPSYNRALSPDRLFSYIRKLLMSLNRSITLEKTSSLKEAIDNSTGHFSDGEIILITGSFYTVGDAMEVMGEEEKMKYLCESN